MLVFYKSAFEFRAAVFETSIVRLFVYPICYFGLHSDRLCGAGPNSNFAISTLFVEPHPLCGNVRWIFAFGCVMEAYASTWVHLEPWRMHMNAYGCIQMQAEALPYSRAQPYSRARPCSRAPPYSRAPSYSREQGGAQKLSCCQVEWYSTRKITVL